MITVFFNILVIFNVWMQLTFAAILKCDNTCTCGYQQCSNDELRCLPGSCIIDCNQEGTSCDGAFVNGTQAQSLTIYCKGWHSCLNSIIHCATDCDIQCNQVGDGNICENTQIICGTGICNIRCQGWQLPCLNTVVDISHASSFQCTGNHCNAVNIITNNPTTNPTTFEPTAVPTFNPSLQPTIAPSTLQPTNSPTSQPSESTATPSLNPSSHPITFQPTNSPTIQPSESTIIPSLNPSIHPTNIPSLAPTIPQRDVNELLSTTLQYDQQTNDTQNKRSNTKWSMRNMFTVVSLGSVALILLLIVIGLLFCLKKKKQSVIHLQSRKKEAIENVEMTLDIMKDNKQQNNTQRLEDDSSEKMYDNQPHDYETTKGAFTKGISDIETNDGDNDEEIYDTVENDITAGTTLGTIE